MELNLTVQRFDKGHPFYSDAIIENTDINKGAVGKFQAVFGQIIDDNHHRICYTMERLDTLIPEGTYPFTYYFSPLNKCNVVLLKDVPGFEFIELHVANFPYEVKGCTALGEQIDVSKPALIQSRNAFNYLMSVLDGQEGTITYETLK